VRLAVNAEFDNVFDSYAVMSTGEEFELRVPSGSQNEAGAYTYEVNYLSVWEYTAAFTCQANDDISDMDGDIVFSEPQSFVIEDGVTTEINF